ncbi:MAG: foldase protein PrsA [Pseudonocardia sp.]
MRVKAALAWSLGEAIDMVRARRLPATAAGRIVLAAVLAVVLGGLGTLAYARATALPAGAAFAVGDRVVSVDELDRRIDTLRALYGVQPPVEDPARMDTFRRDAAKAVAVGMILDDAAAEREIGIADTKVRATLDQFVAGQFGDDPAARERFVRALGNVGATEQAVLDEIRQQFAVSELFNRVTEDVSVTETEARAVFPQYAERLGVPEKRGLRNIVVTSEEQAVQIADQARAGADFPGLARTFSLDGSTRDTGGDLGQVTAAQLLPGYAQAAFGASAGGVFGPVQNDFGWNVGQVVEVVPGRPAQLDAVLPQLTRLVDIDRRNAVWADWLAGAIADADVRYAQAYQPADPLAVPGDPAAGAVPGAVPGVAGPAAPPAPAAPVSAAPVPAAPAPAPAPSPGGPR